MKITFHGAAQEVTGSCHLIEWHGRRLLLDCGLVQGGKDRHERNRAPFPFSPADLDLVVLSHAHIDHGGRLPALRNRGDSTSDATWAAGSTSSSFLFSFASFDTRTVSRPRQNSSQQMV